MSPYEYIMLKQNISRFFQGKNVKVSIFIQEGIQDNDGILRLPMKDTWGDLSPPGVILPGSVVKYKTNGVVESEYKINIETASFYQKNNSSERLKIKSTLLGENMYDSERKSKFLKHGSDSNNTVANNQIKKSFIENASSLAAVTELNARESCNEDVVSGSMSYVEDTEKRKANLEYLKKEFGSLADLLNVPVRNEQESDIFKIDLFSMRTLKGGVKNKDNDDEIYVEVERQNNLDKIKNMFDDMNIESNPKEDEDDLLDLMDMASK
jgi:hypothetical protein